MEIQTPLPIPEADVREPVVASYTDFREYLRDFYDYKVHLHKNSYGQYSYKTFSAAANIKSPNYLKMIIEGERNLSVSMMKNFAQALGFDKDTTAEFILLVEYGQSLDHLARNQKLKNLNEFRMRRKIRSGEVQTETIDNVPRWISYVLHALADQQNADFSIEGLREHLQGKATADEIRKSLQKLFDMQALKLDAETGRVRKGMAQPIQEEIPGELIRKIQSELMYMGMEALINDRSQDREIGTLTVCLKEEEFEKLKFELRHLRKRILKDAMMARDQGPGDRVYQFNIQLFPISRKSRTRPNLIF